MFEVFVSNVICIIVSVTVTLSRNVSHPMNVQHSLLAIPVPWCLNLRFLLVVTLLNAPWSNMAHNKPQHLQVWSRFKHQHCLACCTLLLWQGTNWTVQLKNGKHEPTIQKSHEENLTAGWKHSLWSHIALTREINIRFHSFPLPLFAHELIHSTQRRQHYHEP